MSPMRVLKDKDMHHGVFLSNFNHLLILARKLYAQVRQKKHFMVIIENDKFIATLIDLHWALTSKRCCEDKINAQIDFGRLMIDRQNNIGTLYIVLSYHGLWN